MYDVGDYVLYQIGVKNAATAKDEAPIYYLYDQLPEGLEYVGIADGWSNPTRPLPSGTTKRDRRGLWWVWGHHYDPTYVPTGSFTQGRNNDYGTSIALGNDLAYAYKHRIIATDGATGGDYDIFRTSSISGQYAAEKDLAGTIRFRSVDEQGRLNLSIRDCLPKPEGYVEEEPRRREGRPNRERRGGFAGRNGGDHGRKNFNEEENAAPENPKGRRREF